MLKKNTYFVDIDGTLVKYRTFDKLITEPSVPITDVINLVNEEYEKGNHIVLTSARPISMKEFTMREMRSLGVKYNYLILGIGRGKRFLINDKSETGEKKAYALNLDRDKGLKN